MTVDLRYRYKKPRWVILFTLLDFVGEVARRALSLLSNFWRRGEPPEPRRILVLRLDHIGDVLCSTPALRALRERFPQAHIAVLTGPWAADVLRGNPDVDETLVFRAPWFDRGGDRLPLLPALLTTARRLRGQRFDLALDLRGDFRHVLLMALAGLPYRVGYADTGGGFLLNKMVPRAKYQHEVQRSLDVVRALGADNAQPTPTLAIGGDDREFVARWLAQQAVSHDGLLVAMHAGAGCSSRLWHAERFAAVGNALAERWGATLALTGSAGEAKLVEEIARRLQAPFLNLAGALTLKQLAALLERCALVVTVDSGPMHVAAAVGTPVVVAFSGITTLDEWRPLGDGHIAIQKSVPCLGCELKVCPKQVRCMDLISAEEILSAAEQQLLNHTG